MCVPAIPWFHSLLTEVVPTVPPVSAEASIGVRRGVVADRSTANRHPCRSCASSRWRAPAGRTRGASGTPRRRCPAGTRSGSAPRSVRRSCPGHRRGCPSWPVGHCSGRRHCRCRLAAASRCRRRSGANRRPEQVRATGDRIEGPVPNPRLRDGRCARGIRDLGAGNPGPWRGACIARTHGDAGPVEFELGRVVAVPDLVTKTQGARNLVHLRAEQIEVQGCAGRPATRNRDLDVVVARPGASGIRAVPVADPKPRVGARGLDVEPAGAVGRRRRWRSRRRVPGMRRRRRFPIREALCP